MRLFFLLLVMLLGAFVALVIYIAVPAIRDSVNRARQRFYLWNLRMLADLGGATMAGAPKKARQGARTGSQSTELIIEHNRLCTAMDTLLAKLDADAGVTDANFVALIGGTYSRIGGLDGRDPAGTAVT